jgi:hypothetical protein
MALRAVFGINLNLDYGQADIARIESAIHRGLQEEGIPVIDVEFDGFEPGGGPLQQPGLNPFEAPGPPGPLGPPGPFGRQL